MYIWQAKMSKLVVCNVALWIFYILLAISLATNNWLTMEWIESENSQTINILAEVGLFKACFTIDEQFQTCITLYDIETITTEDLVLLGLLCLGSLVILISNIMGSRQSCQGLQPTIKDITRRGIIGLIGGFLVAVGICWHNFHIYKEVVSRETIMNGVVSRGWSFFLACSGVGGVALTSIAFILLADTLNGRVGPQNGNVPIWTSTLE